MPQPGTRKAAQIVGLPFYFTWKPCKNGHYADRQTSNGSCVVCARARKCSPEGRAWQAAYRVQTAGKAKFYQQVYASQHREDKAAYDKLYRARNRDKRAAQDRAYRERLRAEGGPS